MSTVDLNRLRALVDASEKSPEAISKLAGLGATAVKDILRRKSRRPAFDTLSKIANVLGVNANDLISRQPQNAGVSSTQSLEYVGEVRRRVPIVGEVRAGVFHIISDTPEPSDWLYFDDPAYRGLNIYALRVVGNSMDLVYPDGTIVLVAPAAERSVFEGDIVVVRRRQGLLIETTLKEISAGEQGTFVLSPRSTDPAHQIPITICSDAHNDQEPEIIGIVVASYHRRSRPTATLIQFGARQNDGEEGPS